MTINKSNNIFVDGDMIRFEPLGGRGHLAIDVGYITVIIEQSLDDIEVRLWDQRKEDDYPVAKASVQTSMEEMIEWMS